MPPDNPNFALIRAYEQAKTANPKALAALIRAHDMTWEMVPSEQLDKPEVWEALAEHMPLTALVRNLATLTRVGTIAPMKSAWVCERLNAIGNPLTEDFTRIHPIAVLSALLTYRAGKGARPSCEGLVNAHLYYWEEDDSVIRDMPPRFVPNARRSF